LKERIVMEADEDRGAEHEPVTKVSWLPTVLWILAMILVFNLVAGVVVYYFMQNPQ